MTYKVMDIVYAVAIFNFVSHPRESWFLAHFQEKTNRILECIMLITMHKLFPPPSPCFLQGGRVGFSMSR